jgi:hypothetical protein
MAFCRSWLATLEAWQGWTIAERSARVKTSAGQWSWLAGGKIQAGERPSAAGGSVVKRAECPLLRMAFTLANHPLLVSLYLLRNGTVIALCWHRTSVLAVRMEV